MPEVKVVAKYDGNAIDKGLKDLQKDLATTAVAANKLDSSLNQGAKGANQAGNALLNLGRIAQDAPFGFIGISNNINPLLESFQRLKVETGSTSGALKALAGSLAGGAGLGLAVSVATGLLTVLAQKGFFESSKAADEAAESNKKYKQALDGVFSSVAKEAAEVTSLIAVLKSETETRQRKLQALKELQKINPEIFKGLTLEKGAVEGLDAAYKSYVENLKVVIAAKLKQAQIEEVTTKILKLEGAELSSLQKAGLKFADSLRQANKSQYGFARADLKALEKERELKKLRLLLDDYVSQLQEISGGIKIDIDKEKVEASKKKVETITDVIADLSKEIDFLNAKQIAFGTNESKAKISEIEKTIQRLIKDFKVDPKDSIINKLLTGGTIFNQVQGFNIPGIEGLKKDTQERINAAFESQPPVTIQVPVQVQTILDESTARDSIDQEGYKKALRSVMIDEGLNQILAEFQAKAISGLFDVLNVALTGGNVGDAFGAFFGGLLDTLGKGIQELGVQTLAAGKLILSVKKLFGTTAGIGASIGLIALGTLIRAAASAIKAPKFATGGTFQGGGTFLAGERGPELITAPRGTVITPNAQTNAILGANQGGGQVFFEIEGRKLVGILQNTNAYLGRNGQL